MNRRGFFSTVLGGFVASRVPTPLSFKGIPLVPVNSDGITASTFQFWRSQGPMTLMPEAELAALRKAMRDVYNQCSAPPNVSDGYYSDWETLYEDDNTS